MATTRSASIVAEDCEASSVEELLQEAKDKQHKKIFLNYKGLTEIPTELVEDEETFRHLQHLYLKRNLLKTLPTNIGNLKGLVELYLHSNCLTSLPDEICNLVSLQSLDVSNNRLKSLPASLGEVTSLQKLFLPDNLITALPAELGKLQNLCVLEASCNQLVGLPVELCNCTKLRSLCLTKNKLRWLPRQLTSLGCLEELTVSGNKLMCLPMDLGLWQENLRTVYVDNNPLLHALPFSLWKKKLGATSCGTEELSMEQSRSVHIFKSNGLSAILPPELRLIKDGHEPVSEVLPLLELSLAAAHRLKDTLDLSTLPRSLSDLAEMPTAHCMAPSCYEKPIFTMAWVHLLKLDWAQPWQRTQESIGFVGFCCSKECLRTFKKIPVPTF
ncbi:leucine-rich repeat-containing protein 28-like [Acanthaster planci]|uniref:Leucine-rich repeat-containing protein 28-like n=1 Tax=Acanthaster planci TaxID=133434 RepID=A0A8B7ZT66_ACAPL|nr:leucine-rich repeat-containing protein 28-like [Acanthaster planci]XP_022108618.1 leucine-rich repeat-containing protein 28-like [Acanthaster planci]